MEAWGPVAEGEYGRWERIGRGNFFSCRRNISLTLFHLLSYPSDPILLSVVSDLLESLSSHRLPSVSKVILQTSLPLLTSVIDSKLVEAQAAIVEEPSPLIEASVELISALLTGASEEIVKSINVVNLVCPSVMKLMMASKDRDVLQYGLKILTILVRKDCPTLLAW